MADKEREDSGPSLEMPSLSGLFRRRRSRKDADEASYDEPGTPPDTDVEPSSPATDTRSRPLFADEADAAPATTVTRIAEADDHAEPDDDAEQPSRRARRQRGPVLAAFPPRLVAVATGALVGLLAVGLTYVGLVGCDAWRGTQACGGPGLLFLVVILAAMVLVGALLLRAAGIGDATSTSGLGVGIFAVVCLLVLVDELFSPWMLVVLPVVGALGFALSHWVTTHYGDSAKARG